MARAEPDLPVLVDQDPDKLSLEAVLKHCSEGFIEIKTTKMIDLPEPGEGLLSG